MTMTVDARLSQECLAYMMAEGGWKTVWKSLNFQEELEQLVSPYQRQFSWEPGWLDAGGSQEENARHEIVCQGQRIDSAAIHVYFNKPNLASSYMSWYQTLVPLRVHIDDFIGAGAEHFGVVATFRRVFLTHADCELAIKCCLEERAKLDGGVRKTRLFKDSMRQERSPANMIVDFRRIQGDVTGLDTWTLDALRQQSYDLALQQTPMTATEVLQMSPAESSPLNQIKKVSFNE